MCGCLRALGMCHLILKKNFENRCSKFQIFSYGFFLTLKIVQSGTVLSEVRFLASNLARTGVSANATCVRQQSMADLHPLFAANRPVCGNASRFTESSAKHPRTYPACTSGGVRLKPPQNYRSRCKPADLRHRILHCVRRALFPAIPT